MRIHISPSDFAWLIDRCPRCYWLKCRRIVEAREQLPKIFTTIDEGMKQHVSADAMRGFNVPVAKRINRSKVRSRPIQIDGHEITIGGYLDALWELEDGNHAIEDFKTTEPTPAKAKLYTRQLHGYQFAIENPEEGTPVFVTRLGITFFTPQAFKISPDNRGAVVGYFQHTDIPVDRAEFLAQVGEIAKMCSQDKPPAPGTHCSVCHHVYEINRYLANRP